MRFPPMRFEIGNNRNADGKRRRDDAYGKNRNLSVNHFSLLIEYIKP